MGEQTLNLSCTMYKRANFRSAIKSIKCMEENILHQRLIAVFLHRHHITIQALKLKYKILQK